MKRLGQHFLKNKSALKKIIRALDLQPKDLIVEIGAGHGELTNEVLGFSFEVLDKNKNTIKILAIEKDSKLADELKERFSEEKNIQIICGDALKILPQLVKTYHLKPNTYKLFGNIPYYITGYLLRILSEAEHKPSLCVFTVQKEVAERIVARPPRMNPVRGREGSQRASASNGMNRLAAITQFWAYPKILFHIPRKDFSPPPEVDSAVIKLETRKWKMENGKIAAEKYYETVKILFAQPRKTILNNLATSDPEQLRYVASMGQATRGQIEEKLRATGINPQDRPQDLSVEKIIQISSLNFSSVNPASRIIPRKV